MGGSVSLSVVAGGGGIGIVFGLGVLPKSNTSAAERGSSKLAPAEHAVSGIRARSCGVGLVGSGLASKAPEGGAMDSPNTKRSSVFSWNAAAEAGMSVARLSVLNVTSGACGALCKSAGCEES